MTSEENHELRIALDDIRGELMKLSSQVARVATTVEKLDRQVFGGDKGPQSGMLWQVSKLVEVSTAWRWLWRTIFVAVAGGFAYQFFTRSQ